MKKNTLQLESRLFPRADAELALLVSIDGAPPIPGRLVDVSEGGAKISAAAPCAVGARIEVTIVIPPDPCRHSIEGVVVRVAPSGLGVTWLALDDAAANAIARYVSLRAPLAWDEGRTLPRSVAEAFIPIVRRIALSLARNLPAHVSVEDLVGAGFVALVELHAKGSVVGADFEPMARVRIRGAMLDHLRKADPVARRSRKALRQIHAARAKLELSLGRAATHEEVQRAVGMSADAYGRALARASQVAPVDFGEVEDPRASNGAVELEGREARRTVLRAFDALPERLQRVLDLYYGEDLTLRAIGNLLGVSEARASQLIGQAVGKLRGAYVESLREAA